VEKAKQLIQEKIRGRLASGPSEMRRTFQMFDRDGSGSISMAEFRTVLKENCGLQFEQKILDALMKEIGVKEMDFTAFTKLVLGSNVESDNSFSDNSALLSQSDLHGNTDVMIRRRVREKWRSLIAMFKRTADKNGDMSPKQVKSVLYKHDILMADKIFDKMVKEMDTDGDGSISYNEFLAYFDSGQADEVSLTPTIHSMPLAKAGLDEGLLQFSLSNLFIWRIPYKLQEMSVTNNSAPSYIHTGHGAHPRQGVRPAAGRTGGTAARLADLQRRRLGLRGLVRVRLGSEGQPGDHLRAAAAGQADRSVRERPREWTD
jgi:Ca2+-binding EF-hand superfamily protein